ncbi:MAG: AraC family transcriptional regulator [Anaerolineae bacterium]|nr:AraC family transcriptional regulator [Anaerolineae bacterium]
MDDITVMVRALDFIESHLREPVGVADMAAAVSYSLYHFCRTFKAATHFTPYDYLMRRRIAEAAREVLSSERKLIDIAFDYQFNNPETFSRAFKRVMKTQPTQWRKQGQAGDRQTVYRQIMPRLTEAHLAHLQRGAPWRPTVEESPALNLIGVMTLGSDIAAAWERLRRETVACGLADTDGGFFGWTWCAADGTVTATMAAQVGSSTCVDACALVAKALPAHTYLRVTHHGSACDLALTLDYAYHTWLPQSDYHAVFPWYVEHYSTIPARSTDGVWDVYLPVSRVE